MTNWQNFHLTSTSELQNQWQTQEWINIGLKPIDYNFCSWLRDIKKLTLGRSSKSQ